MYINCYLHNMYIIAVYYSGGQYISHFNLFPFFSSIAYIRKSFLGIHAPNLSQVKLNKFNICIFPSNDRNLSNGALVKNSN